MKIIQKLYTTIQWVVGYLATIALCASFGYIVYAVLFK